MRMITAEIRPDVTLDARLALVHRGQGWLAVADVHYGYAAAMRDRGGLFPIWGDATLEERLRGLCEDHQPETLVVNGDLVHGRVKREDFAAFLGRLQELAARVVLVAGNHDRSPTARAAGFVDRFRTPGFLFHHGHLEIPTENGEIEILGHFHPAAVLRDGAGLRLKLPAFVEETGASTRWILPAFSPWAGGAEWPETTGRRVRRWVCAPKRILPLDGPGLARDTTSGESPATVP